MDAEGGGKERYIPYFGIFLILYLERKCLQRVHSNIIAEKLRNRQLEMEEGGGALKVPYEKCFLTHDAKVIAQLRLWKRA